MRRLRLFGLVLFASLSLGAAAVTTASAAETEAGLLYLSGESGQVTSETTGGIGTLTSAGGKITCTTGKSSGKSTQTEKHVTSGTGTGTFNGCKETKGETKVACKTEGAAAEEVVVAGQVTLFNALDAATKKVLEPGIGITVTPTLKIKCGAVSIVEVKGTVLGLLVVTSLTADVTTGAMHFVNQGELCDTENAFCKKSQEKANELLANFAGTFETATMECEEAATISKMMLVDD